MEKTHIEIETNIIGKKCALYMQPYDNLGLADEHRDRSLAVDRAR